MKSRLLRFVLTFFYHSDHDRNLSSSSSDYSYDSDASTRRASKGGADRRRVAIVQMPSHNLALVAPPDAASTNYTHPDQTDNNISSQSLTPSHMFSPLTPEIGQPKEIHIPVAGPVVVNLDSHLRNPPPPDPSSFGTPISSYLHYQPGIFLFFPICVSRLKLLQVYIPSLVRYPLLREPIST
jgi:hypothetical protein